MSDAAYALSCGWGVDRLVPGSVEGVRAFAARVAQLAEVTADAAVGLSRVDPVWTGVAYAAFWEALLTHRQGFVEATVAFDAASAAMFTYAVELEVAKASAAVAQQVWAAGMDVARAYAWDQFVSGETLSPPTAADSVMLAFSPGGAGLRADAVSRLDGAWADVDRAARAALDALVAAQAKAPQAPHWWDTAGPKITGLFAPGDNPVKHEFAAGAVRGLIDLGLSGDRSIQVVVTRSLDSWEKAQHINPAGGIHGVGAIAGTLLIPGFGEEGFLASLAAKLVNRSVTRVIEDTGVNIIENTGIHIAGADSISALEQGAAKVPREWGEGIANSKGAGTRWFDPAAPQTNGVRIDAGTPGSSLASQQVDHVVVRSGGRILGLAGRQAHNWSPSRQPTSAHPPI